MQVWSPTYSQLTVRSINQSLGQGFDSLMLHEEVREVLDDFEVSTMAYTAEYKFEPYLEENEEIDSIYFSGVFPIEEINYF